MYTDGQYICCGNYLAVQFFGDRRVFKVVRVTPREAVDTGGLQLGDSNVEDSVAHDMSALSLQDTPGNTPSKDHSDVTGSPQPVEVSDTEQEESSSNGLVQVCKITLRTKLVFVEENQYEAKVSE